MTDRRERQAGGGFATRLREVVADYGSASALAKVIDRSEGAVRKWLRGESEPNVTDLRALCEETHTSLEWIATGRGTRQMPVGVEEDAATYQARPPAGVDVGLLENIIRAVEDELGRSGLSLSPAKRSMLMGMLYEQCRERGEVDRETLLRLLRLAG